MGYLANFIVYTLAMVGVIVFALLVFKKSTVSGGAKSSKHLKVIDTLSLAPRKTLYVVSCGNEKFLIAGDTDKTTLISKLEDNNTNVSGQALNVQNKEVTSIEDVGNTFKETMKSVAKHDFMDRTNVGITSSLLNKKQTSNSVMRNLADIMKG